MKKIILNLIGWYGVIIILVAYFLNSFSIISNHSFLYQFFNTTGAIGIVITSLKKKDYQPAVLNLAWALIGIIALINIFI